MTKNFEQLKTIAGHKWESIHLKPWIRIGTGILPSVCLTVLFRMLIFGAVVQFFDAEPRDCPSAPLVVSIFSEM